MGGFTKDNIYNLMFTSAYYECYKDNFPCGSGIISNPYYIGQEYFDLNKTVMTKGKVGEEDGFTITGGKATYVGNKTRNYVDVEASCYGTSDVKIISWLGTQW